MFQLAEIFFILILCLAFSLGIAVDCWMFFKITNLKVKFNWKYIVFFLLLLGSSFLTIFKAPGLIANLVLEIIIFTFFFRKEVPAFVSFSTVIFVESIDVLETLLLSMVTNFIANISIALVVLISSILLVKKYHAYIYEQLSGKNGKVFLALEIYFYLVAFFLNLKMNFDTKFISNNIFFAVFIALQLLFAVAIYLEMVKIQQYLLERETRRELEEKYQQQKKYARHLEKDEDKLRSFRHDYQNMFNSLKLSAQKGNLNEVVEKLDQFTKNNLDEKALLKYQNLNHIKVDTLKSLLITKLTEMSDLGIKYQVECTEEIFKIPREIDEIDLLRIIGIALDNAIEECRDKDHSWINIMLYGNNKDFEIEIRNSVSEKKPKISQLSEKGFTTKKGHHGLGLYTIKQINERYPRMNISYMINKKYFDFYLIIEGKK